MSFSNFGTHGTPHNQYLEVWFKTGLVGLLWYLSIIVLGAARVWKSRTFLSEDLCPKSLYVMLVLVLVSNFAQPNLSYSPTGNLVFLIFGVFAILPRRGTSHKYVAQF
jgi:O-antigen ligase